MQCFYNSLNVKVLVKNQTKTFDGIFLLSINLTHLTLDRQTDIACADYFKIIIFRKNNS